MELITHYRTLIKATMDNKFIECIAQDRFRCIELKYKYSKMRDPITWTKCPIIQKWIHDDYGR
jgi:hypothetical protein